MGGPEEVSDFDSHDRPRKSGAGGFKGKTGKQHFFPFFGEEREKVGKLTHALCGEECPASGDVVICCIVRVASLSSYLRTSEEFGVSNWCQEQLLGIFPPSSTTIQKEACSRLIKVGEFLPQSTLHYRHFVYSAGQRCLVTPPTAGVRCQRLMNEAAGQPRESSSCLAQWAADCN